MEQPPLHRMTPEYEGKRDLTPHRRFWTNPITVLLGSFLLFIGAQALAALFLAPLVVAVLAENYQIVVFIAIEIIIVFSVLAALLHINKFKWSSIGWRWPKSWKFLISLPLIIMAYMAVSVSLTMLAQQYLPGFRADEVQDVGFKNLANPLALSLAFISLVVLTPILEETIFRGVLFKGLRKRTSFWLTALATSLLFALAHGQWNVAIDTFAMGMVCAYVVEKTDSILPSILIHALKNGLAFTLLFILKVG